MSASPTRLYVCHDPEEEGLAARLGDWPHTNDDREAYHARMGLAPDSPAAEPHRARLRTQLDAADAFVCILSRTTFANPWVHWEIEAAKSGDRRLPLVAILVYEHVHRPPGLVNCGAVFVPFRRDSVATAIAWAIENRPTSDDLTFSDE